MRARVRRRGPARHRRSHASSTSPCRARSTPGSDSPTSTPTTGSTSLMMPGARARRGGASSSSPRSRSCGRGSSPVLPHAAQRRDGRRRRRRRCARHLDAAAHDHDVRRIGQTPERRQLSLADRLGGDGVAARRRMPEILEQRCAVARRAARNAGSRSISVPAVIAREAPRAVARSAAGARPARAPWPRGRPRPRAATAPPPPRSRRSAAEPGEDSVSTGASRGASAAPRRSRENRGRGRAVAPRRAAQSRKPLAATPATPARRRAAGRVGRLGKAPRRQRAERQRGGGVEVCGRVVQVVDAELHQDQVRLVASPRRRERAPPRSTDCSHSPRGSGPHLPTGMRARRADARAAREGLIQRSRRSRRRRNRPALRAGGRRGGGSGVRGASRKPAAFTT